MHSFISVHVHCVWSTKNRGPSLHSKLRERLWPYLGGIARENKMKALAIGGAADHVHIVLSLPATLSVAKMVQLLKGNSSKWIHEAFSECVRLNGRKVTARSVLVSLLLMRRGPIFEIKANTIVVELFARNLR